MRGQRATSRCKSNVVALSNQSMQANLKSHLAPYRDTVEGIGWVLEVSDTSAGTFRRFKNGKLRKTPDVHIEYNEYHHDTYDVDDDGELVEVPRKAERPWYVASTHKAQAATFKHHERAIERFMELCVTEAAAFELT